MHRLAGLELGVEVVGWRRGEVAQRGVDDDVTGLRWGWHGSRGRVALPGLVGRLGHASPVVVPVPDVDAGEVDEDVAGAESVARCGCEGPDDDEVVVGADDEPAEAFFAVVVDGELFFAADFFAVVVDGELFLAADFFAVVVDGELFFAADFFAVVLEDALFVAEACFAAVVVDEAEPFFAVPDDDVLLAVVDELRVAGVLFAGDAVVVAPDTSEGEVTRRGALVPPLDDEPMPVADRAISSTCPARAATVAASPWTSAMSRFTSTRLIALSTSVRTSRTSCLRLLSAAWSSSSASRPACFVTFLRDPSTPERVTSSWAASLARFAVSSPSPDASSTYAWIERLAISPPDVRRPGRPAVGSPRYRWVSPSSARSASAVRAASVSDEAPASVASCTSRTAAARSASEVAPEPASSGTA